MMTTQIERILQQKAELEAKIKAEKQKKKQTLSKLNARLRAAESRKNKDARKEDTRRKILIGALAKEHMERNPDSDFGKKLQGMMEEYLIKDADRRLFGLALLPAEEQARRKESHSEKTQRRNAVKGLSNGLTETVEYPPRPMANGFVINDPGQDHHASV